MLVAFQMSDKKSRSRRFCGKYSRVVCARRRHTECTKK